MSKGNRNRRARAKQNAKAERDVYAAGRDQAIINVSAGPGPVVTGDSPSFDNRRIDIAAGAIPHAFEVQLPGQMQNLPRCPAPVFEGRAGVLDTLTAGLAARGGAAVMQAVFGLGGVGKSELALQYAHSHRTDYPLVWWITAADAGQVQAGLAALAARLCSAVAVAATTADAAAWATGWLQAHGGWLLILDNVEDPAHIEPLLGQIGAGHVIITSRRDINWGQMADPVRLDVLDSAPAALVLVAHTGQQTPTAADAAAGIAEELGFLPLALDQAAAYIVQQRISCVAYLDSLRRDPARMHAAPGAGGDAQGTIARLWDLHITAIRDSNPDAVRLLGVLGRYAPDGIPRAMLGGPAPREDTDEALGLLASYSMITLTSDSVSIHRLLQAIILARPDDTADDGRGLRDTALDWLDRAIPADLQTNMANWQLLRALVPHAEALASDFPPGDHSVALGRVLHKVALFLNSQGDYVRASVLGQSALMITEKTLGPGHLHTAMSLASLANTYQALGRSADALPLAERALAITKKAPGPDHPIFANRLDNLAIIYRGLGRPADALPLAERALAIAETAVGPDHRYTAIALGNLAATYGDLGRTAEALPLEQRALAITEKTLGPDHPDTAVRLASLADAYRGLARAADAPPLLERALAITEKTLGADHPQVAVMLTNLAGIHSDLGQAGEALPLAERALAVTEAALGPNHPDTATRMGSLALIYMILERRVEALQLQQRALAITEAALGPDHPDTAFRMGLLAGAYVVLGQAADALPLLERALAVTEKTLGSDHPQVALTLANLAGTYLVLERAADALPLAERALAITEAALGAGHPGTVASLSIVAEIYQEVGRTADAVTLHARATQIRSAFGG